MEIVIQPPGIPLRPQSDDRQVMLRDQISKFLHLLLSPEIVLEHDITQLELSYGDSVHVYHRAEGGLVALTHRKGQDALGIRVVFVLRLKRSSHESV